MVDWLAIAARVILGVLVFAIGLYLAKTTLSILPRLGIGTNRGRVSGRRSRGLILILVSLVTLQLVWSASCAARSDSGALDVAKAREYRTGVTLGTTNVAIGGGGYVTGVFLHPLEPNLVYIRTDVGGFFRWNPDDESWIPISDRFTLEQKNYYGGEALALDPNDPDIVYIAAGRYLWAGPQTDWSVLGTIFKSTDRGNTWNKLDIDLPMGGNQGKRAIGERLAVNPFDSQVIFFGSRRDGLWKSSNEGKTWEQVNDFPGKLADDIGITGIAFNPNESGVVYANAYGDGLYLSTDTGVTWSKIEGSPAEVRRMAPSSDGTLYVTSEGERGVSQYVDGTWNDITPPQAKADAVFNGLSVNRANSREILVSLGATSRTKIYHSLDGGANWTEKQRTLNNTVPWWTEFMLLQPHISAIEFDPTVPGKVWLTDWYGIWQTENIEANPSTWTNYQKGHEQIVTFDLVSPPSGPLLLSGLADVDGFYHNNGLNTYPSRRMGLQGESHMSDTYAIAYCQTDPSQLVRIGGSRSSSKYVVATSEDGGKTWQELTSYPGDEMPIDVAMSATNPDIFVVTVSEGQPLYTENGGATWERVSGLPDGPRGPWYWSKSLAADTVEGKTFYYYFNDKIYRSTDGGASFSVVYEPLKGANKWHFLKTMPGIKGEVWGAFDWQGLHHSSDGGETFSKIDNVERAYLFAFGKPRPGSEIPALYLYGKIANQGEGIFSSLDLGKTWKPIGDPAAPIGNDPNVMEASKQEFGLVFIGTKGRGIYYGTLEENR